MKKSYKMDNDFSFATVKDFDEHISKSIRGYTDLIADVENLGDYFIRQNSDVLDIGCSTGKLLKRMADKCTLNNVEFTGIEREANFWDDMNHNAADNIKFFRDDIVNFSFAECDKISYAQSIFTLQFLDVKLRDKVVQNVYNSMIEGGGFVSAEKVYSNCAKMQDIKTSLYYQYKNEHFSYDDIFKKEKSLRSMMNLKNLNEIIKYYYDIGFSSVETFWQSHNFVAVVCIK